MSDSEHKVSITHHFAVLSLATTIVLYIIMQMFSFVTTQPLFTSPKDSNTKKFHPHTSRKILYYYTFKLHVSCLKKKGLFSGFNFSVADDNAVIFCLLIGGKCFCTHVAFYIDSGSLAAKKCSQGRHHYMWSTEHRCRVNHV